MTNTWRDRHHQYIFNLWLVRNTGTIYILRFSNGFSISKVRGKKTAFILKPKRNEAIKITTGCRG